jgi:Ser/Thr protein kinase RdoA (MazF antagonist)
LLAGECYEVQHFIEGELCDRFNAAHLSASAYTLGDYHRLVRHYDARIPVPEGDRYGPRALDSSLHDLSAFWEAHGHSLTGNVQQRLSDHLADLRSRFASHRELPRLVIHGDYHGDNLLCRGASVVGVLDYDKASWQPRVAEIAEAAIYFSSPKQGSLKRLAYPGPLQWAPLAAFIAAYATENPICTSEAVALPDYIRCIWMQMSICHPLLGLLAPGDHTAIEEILILADWAKENSTPITDLARAGPSL